MWKIYENYLKKVKISSEPKMLQWPTSTAQSTNNLLNAIMIIKYLTYAPTACSGVKSFTIKLKVHSNMK